MWPESGDRSEMQNRRRPERQGKTGRIVLSRWRPIAGRPMALLADKSADSAADRTQGSAPAGRTVHVRRSESDTPEAAPGDLAPAPLRASVDRRRGAPSPAGGPGAAGLRNSLCRSTAYLSDMTGQWNPHRSSARQVEERAGSTIHAGAPAIDIGAIPPRDELTGWRPPRSTMLTIARWPAWSVLNSLAARTPF